MDFFKKVRNCSQQFLQLLLPIHRLLQLLLRKLTLSLAVLLSILKAAFPTLAGAWLYRKSHEYLGSQHLLRNIQSIRGKKLCASIHVLEEKGTMK